VWALATIALALVAIACGPASPENDEPFAPERPTSIVVTAEVAEARMRTEVKLSAEAAPWAAVTVTAEVSGRVVAVEAEVGDQVRRGDPLARIDDTEAGAGLTQAEASLEGARAARDQAEIDLERGELLRETRDISVGDLDRLRLARTTATARHGEAEAAVVLARKRLDDTVVRAPFAGIVSRREVEMGSWLAPGAPVARLLDRERLKVRAAASQTDRARLGLGMPASIEATALPGVELEGRVRLLGQEADPATGTYLVEVAVDRPVAPDGSRLLPGMQATMTIVLEEATAVVIPRAAVVETAGGPAVFTVERGTARRVLLRLGRETSELVEVLEGLEPGEIVAVQGQHVLRDGDPVEVQHP